MGRRLRYDPAVDLAQTQHLIARALGGGEAALGDLLEHWRGRLDGTELVVLSACESRKGRLERDEGMFALLWGFCFAVAAVETFSRAFRSR